MKYQFFKKFLSAALSAAMLLTVTPSMLAGAEDAEPGSVYNLKWPDAGLTQWGGQGTVPDWALNATPEEQEATIKAIQKEYEDQKAAGYDLGIIEHPEFDGNGFNTWADMVNVQFVGGDNQGNPWGQSNRDWAIIIAPFPGMAFSVKGHVVKTFTNPKTAISNAFEWTNPENGETLFWQMFDDGEYFIAADGTGGVNNGWGFAPGSQLKGSVVDAMVYAYADKAYNDVPIGLTKQDGQVDDATGIVYQEFFGPYSTGKTQQTDRQDTAYGSYGISYLVGKSLDAEEAFIVTDKIMTAWADTWGNPTATNPDRFSVSGAPIANQVVGEDGSVSQLFEKVEITVSADGVATVKNTDNSLKNFAIEGGVNFVNGNDITVVVGHGADVTKLTASFEISEKAAVSPAAGETDFTNPVTYTVTAENGDKATYTVTVVVAPETPAAADKEAADKVDAAIEALPAADELYLSDREKVQAVRAAYEALTPLQRYIVTKMDKLTEAEKAIAALEANPLRVTMVGDSITEGVGASSSSKNYVSQTQKLLGSEFDVFNAGVSGKTLMSTPEAYTNTGRYTEGKNFAPDVVTIMLGTNDGKDRYWGLNSATQYNAEQFERELTALINVYRDLPSKPVVMVATSPTVYGKRVDTIDDNYVSQIIEVQKKVAADMGCPVIDINAYTKNHENWFDDGVHPNNTGHAEMAKEFAKAVAEVNKAALSYIQVGDQTLELKDGVFEYTGSVEAGAEIPTVTAVGANGAEVTVEQNAEGELPMDVTITVISKNGNYKSVYTVALKEDNIIPGDMNNDGQVNIQDVMEACKVLARKSADKDPTADEMARGNLDGDNTFSINDVMEICKILARNA